MDLLDSETELVDAWIESATRGFHGGKLAERFRRYPRDTNTPAATAPESPDDSSPSLEPVGPATPGSPPRRPRKPHASSASAISTMTVASTHHAGVARALLERSSPRPRSRCDGDPHRRAESSLYQRYGFAPAAFAADYEFDVRRVSLRRTDPRRTPSSTSPSTVHQAPRRDAPAPAADQPRQDRRLAAAHLPDRRHRRRRRPRQELRADIWMPAAPPEESPSTS